jgi:putative FmdB family regulatory protein
MPVYAYRCQSCGIQFERQQKFEDKPLTRCPECRKGTVRRILQPPAIVFKGSGWYATDHRSPSGQSSFRKGEAESKKTDTTTTTTTTEKAEAKKSDSTAAAETTSTAASTKKAETSTSNKN